MKRIIQWESQHLEIDVMTGKFKEPELPGFDEDNYGDLEDGDQNDSIHNKEIQVQNVMSTPFGFWKVDDTMNPYKQFKMWMGHTNFSITQNVVDTIRGIPGVEVLQVMTRYRFIIGIGELFDIRNVRTDIENLLKCHKDENDMIFDNNVLEQVHELKKQLSKFNQWAIYVFPNGQIDFSTSDETEFGRQLNLYKQAVDYSNGVLIESENE